MFEQSMFASAPPIHTKQGWTTLVSIGIQALGVGILIIIPLIFTDVLPVRHVAEILRVPPAVPKAIEIVATSTQRISRAVDGSLTQPIRIPTTVERIVDPSTPADAAVDPNAIGVEGSTGPQLSSLQNLLESARPREIPVAPLVAKPPVVVSSGVVAGLLISQVKPEYPTIARTTHTQGTVVLHAIIAKDGSIQSLRAASGHPLLVEAAVRAVRQWKYRPYLLNGDPVEVQTEIKVNFTLG